MIGEVVIKKIKRNDYGTNSERLNLSLPQTTITMCRLWARENNMVVSKAFNDLLWLGYAKFREDLEKHD